MLYGLLSNVTPGYVSTRAIVDSATSPVIQNHHIRSQTRLDLGQRGFSTAYDGGPVPQDPEQETCTLTYQRIIIHQEHHQTLGSHRQRGTCRQPQARLGRHGHSGGKHQPDAGSFPGSTPNRQLSAMSFHGGIDHWESQPSSFALRFGGEEGLQRALQHRFRHSDSVVFDLQLDLQSDISGAQCQDATVGHGIDGIYTQVDQRMRQRTRVPTDRQQILGQLLYQSNPRERGVL